MKRSVLLMLATLALFVAPLAGETTAKAVLGKWQATLESPQGSYDATMEFTGSDEELKGTWTGPRGTSDLENVKVEGGKLTFQRNLEFQGNAFTLDYEATVDGDTMSVTIRTPRGERQFTATRAP